MSFRMGIAAALAGMLFAGCANKEKITKPRDPINLNSVTLRMEESANANWPARVALVRVKDAALLPRLTGMKSDAWFGEAGVAFRDAHPEIYVENWEVVPGTVVGPFEVKLRERVAGVLFCDTQASPPPLRLKAGGDLVVVVGDERCRLDAEEEKRGWFGLFGLLR